MNDDTGVDWFADEPDPDLRDDPALRWHADGTRRIPAAESEADRRRRRRYYFFRSVMSGKRAMEWKGKDGWTMIVCRRHRVILDKTLDDYRDGFVAMVTHPRRKRERYPYIQTQAQPYRAQAVADGLDLMQRQRDFWRTSEQRALLEKWKFEDEEEGRRLALGMTQAQVADLLMLAGKWRTQSVQRIESGRLGFGKHLQALAERELSRLEKRKAL